MNRGRFQPGVLGESVGRFDPDFFLEPATQIELDFVR
jgi:hypothetical protein